MNEHVELSVEGAREAADRGELADWVGHFLASPGSDNAELAASLRSDCDHWLGPVELPFDDLNRLAGPPDQPTLERLDEDDLETVEEMEDSIDDGWDPPPLIVSLRGDQLVVEDGNHRIEGLRRAGKREYWSVVCCKDAEQRERFLERSAR